MLSRKLDVIVSLVAMAAVLQVNAADSVAHSRYVVVNRLDLEEAEVP